MIGSTRSSYTELNARDRARGLLDPGTFREILGPFDGVESPHLVVQGIVPQSDDGAVIGRGTLDGTDAVVVAVDGTFLGGGIGEVSGAKVAASLEQAVRQRRGGSPVHVVLLLETGGIRLQEANLGLLAVADIHAAVVELRELGPVVGVITGTVGCFGGMAVAAGLTSHLIMTPGGRLGLNGPEVVETEAGVDELDSADRPLVWSMIGGRQRLATGHVETVVDDDIGALARAVRAACRAGLGTVRSRQVHPALAVLAALDPVERPAPDAYRRIVGAVGSAVSTVDTPRTSWRPSGSLGQVWFDALAEGATEPAPSGAVRVGATTVGDEAATVLAVLPDPDARFPRARHGEVGLEEGWSVAAVVHHIVDSDRRARVRRPIVVVVDVPGQAYGYVEELAGLHQSLAAAVDAVATARLAGHPITALVVGRAVSGGFLAMGLQAGRIIVLDHPGVVVQVMSRAATARITRRTVEELDALTTVVPATAHDGASFVRLGAVHATVEVERPADPSPADIERVRTAVAAATADARGGGTGLGSRLSSPCAQASRAASRRVRDAVAAAWTG